MTKPINTSTIRRYNLIAGVFHLAQMAAVLALADDFSLPIVARYLSDAPGLDSFAEPFTLLDAPVGLTVAIFGVNASMILFGWLQEKYETPGNGGWLPFIFGCIAGIVPWVGLLFYVLSIGGIAATTAPAFVLGIVISLLVLFNTFAIVQYLQYKKVGKWSNYLRGEKTYITLSLVAKSALAWQIFASTLIQ
jgi:hypothetical protein